MNPKIDMYQTAIVIPIYKKDLSVFERISLTQCFKVLSGQYKIYCVKPQSLNLSEIEREYDFDEVEGFDDAYFNDIQGYNRLMLSSEFYKRFLEYEFVLLYQLDAFVFKNDLNYWCAQNLDYIGAPWLRSHDYPDFVKKLKCKIMTPYHIRINKRKKGIPTEYQFENRVGNGGFSLRRVRKFYDLSIMYKELIQFYNAQKHHHFHEDAFWSIEVNRKSKKLNIPNYKVALRFSFENSPERCMQFTKGSLPFGCHAWDRHLDFWRPIFKKCEYNI